MGSILDWQTISTEKMRLSSIADIRQFDYLRCFHLCRTSDVSTYYNNGIRLVPRDMLRQNFRDIFADLPRTTIESALEQFIDPKSPQAVHTGVDSRYLLRYCGHYCVYGSEYLTALAVTITTPDDQDHRQRLKRIGRPTVIVLEIPVVEVPLCDAKVILENIRRLADGDYRNVVGPQMLLDCGVSFDRPLPPEWVADHFHPESIYDPLLKVQYKYTI